MSIQVIVALVLAVIVGGLAGWFARRRTEQSHRLALGAHESEVAQATARARDRAREEKTAAEERAARLRARYDDSVQKLNDLERVLEQQAVELRAARARLEATVPAHGPEALSQPETHESALPSPSRLTGLPRNTRTRRAS